MVVDLGAVSRPIQDVSSLITYLMEPPLIALDPLT